MGLQYYSKNVNNSKEFSPLYANSSVLYHKKHKYPSRPLPSETSMIKTYTNTHTYASIQTACYLQNNIYANISILPPKSTITSNQAPYATLMNTTSIISSSNTDIPINPQILNKNTNNQTYENINLCLTSFTAPLKLNESLLHHKSSTNNINLSSSSHIYLNLEHHKDLSPVISTSKITQQKEEIAICSLEKKQADIETNILETNSDTNTKQTVKKLEVNMAPNCGDKSILYRTKIPPTITQILSTFRQRRTLHRSRRRRQRSSTQLRTIRNSNVMRRQQQQQQSNLNVSGHHTADNQSKRPYNKKRQIKSISNQLYNEIQQITPPDNQSLNSLYAEEGEEQVERFECPTQFHGALQHHVFAWYPTKIYTEQELIPQICSTSENGESNETTNEEEEEEQEEQEEFLPHDTFEDFLLRRRPKSSSSSSSSSTLISDSSTETISHEIPIHPPTTTNHHQRRRSGIALGLDKNDVDFIHNIIQRTQGDHRVSNRITALREAYIRAANKRNDLLKTQKQVSQINTNKQKKKPTIKHSFTASKIRNELQKYDELPAHRRTFFHDDDDDDDTYSANDDYRLQRHIKPTVPSTIHRILNFLTSLKRQLQKNFQDIRSRILIESMAIPTNHISRQGHSYHNSSGLSHRHVSRTKTTHNIIHRTNSHQSIEQSHPFQRHQLHRTHSNTSQLQSQHQYIPSHEQHLSHRRRTFQVTSHQQRSQKIG